MPPTPNASPVFPGRITTTRALFLPALAAKRHAPTRAQQNSYEIFPPFAAAVIIAHATGNAAQATINLWALLFVASRLAFIYCYISDRPMLRSAVFGVNLLCIVALFVAAA